MKKINSVKLLSILLGVILLGVTSCKKYLDVNTNPNAPTDVTPDLILPAALAQTAASCVTFNNYGAWTGGYQANAGGYGGFGAELTYNYSTSFYTSLWSESFNNLNDYQTIVNKTDATGPYKNYNAIAKVMKAYIYLRLIDVYNDVPYSEALKGLSILTPKYDKAEDVYRGLFKEVNEAIASFALPNDGQSTIGTLTSTNSTRVDILTDGTNLFSEGGFPTSKWTEFANTLKLKMLVRIRAVSSMASVFNEEKAKLQGVSFVTYDVKAQPDYQAQSGKQNPAWNAYAFNATGGASQLTTVPTFYAVAFYDGHKIEDRVRGAGVTYKSLTVANQLGDQDPDAAKSQNGTNWYVGSKEGVGGDAIGILKGPTMSQPLMLAAESYFLQAEANLFGIVTGDAQTNFKNGVIASFKYLYTQKNETLSKDYGGDGDYELYRSDNVTPANATSSLSYLVRWEDTDQSLEKDYNKDPLQRKLEAIITQKWIAVNYIHSNEGWSDYRRTGFPKQNATGDKYNNFASRQSTSPRADKLPVRVLYPASEYSVNPSNVPQNVSQFTSRVFYDLD